MKAGAIGWKPGEDVFPLLVCRSDFLQACYRLHTAEDTFGYTEEWKLKPRWDPNQVYLCWTYWLVY